MSETHRRPPKFPLRLDQMATPRKTLVKAPESTSPKTPAAAAPAAPPRHVLRPQQPLQHAAAVAARRAPPTGLGLDSAGVRLRMVERLRAEGLRHEAVLAALAEVPRHRFVDAALVTQAYEDTSLPIGHGQTISKPSVVGRMIELLMGGANAQAQGRLGKVLEIGTGCGYQAALLARLSRQVFSVERVKPLHDKARELMAPLGVANARLVYGDGMLGHPPNAPYDGIIAAAGGDALPPAWLDQLAVGGRIVAPVLDGPARQVLVVVDRTEHGCERSVHEVVQFVPLRSGLVR
ncbi:MAG TPA: protein-L-isoaspartate(D-aspartate) O-methyltransferase [Albitalea sp.]|uniref:protein-L-isoaspartate(D-aspartate) O-methyltransferase n=1 Tax=Piscinibacter sp. TaxID=1903157 RepID=UPI002ED3AB8E